MGYSRPQQWISIEGDNEGLRKELIRTYALAQTIYEDDLKEENLTLPFVHHDTADFKLLKEVEKEYLEKISMVDIFGDFQGLDLTLNKDEDYVLESTVLENLQRHKTQNTEELNAYLKSEQGGGGIAKCYPLSYIQGNFAYYHLFK